MVSLCHPEKDEVTNTDNYDFSGEWFNKDEKLIIKITKTSNGFEAKIPDDGVWKTSQRASGNGSYDDYQNSLKQFWISGNTLHYEIDSYTRDKKTKKSFGPFISTLSLTLSSDGKLIDQGSQEVILYRKS